MVSVKFNVTGIDKVHTILDKAINLEKELVPTIRNICLKFEKDAKHFAPVDTGILRGQDIRSEVIISSNVITGRVGPVNSKKNIAMEVGRKPGSMPPIEALIPWVKRHGMAGKVTGKGFKRVMNTLSVEKNARNIAFLIAKKIACKGIKGHWYMRDSFVANERWALNQINVAANRILK